MTENAENEFCCNDPKSVDLCLARTKPWEIGVEVRRRSDVQIDALSCAKGRKTNRSA